jgi:hypothetical protein
LTRKVVGVFVRFRAPLHRGTVIVDVLRVQHQWRIFILWVV